MALDVESAIDADRFENVIGKKHEVFYRYGYKYTTFELAIMHYQGCIEKMEDWIEKNITPDEFEALDVATQYTNYLEDNYYDVIDCIKNEVVYLLFQNREFLMHFNIFMSDVLPGKSDRKNVPLWVKRAVKYRDRCKCVMCQKDLSGIMDIEEQYENQYDHIVPLEDGGLNDVSNMQLMCSKCNKEKGNIMDKDTKGRPRNGLLTTNGAMLPAGCIAPVCCGGFQRGQRPIWHTTLRSKV